ncbi:hypothetical protein [Polynucleobacter sp. es-EL-1]|uniref:hypothetical protein n=1 Tax=Polynucleobacter sp. es-EL-1 TaxID=1855652 RepID=UPI001BFD09BF|nr:hypothetical protein [Polynucleobacter sp. es-EL-1]QWE10874.1 hypothetical protein FD974_01645 [Polynucleobacter sp. es-EL-1]
MVSQDQNIQTEQGEVSLLDIVNFVQESWKKLAVAVLVGATLGYANWNFLGSYNAELVLLNNKGTDLVSWRTLQKTLPNLAGQMVDENKVPEGQESLYRTLSDSSWWQKNAVPSYAMTRSDLKELASIAGLESSGANISSLTLSAAGPSKEKAIQNVIWAKDFALQGASYLAVKSLLSAQESQLISIGAEIEKKVNATQIELGYQQERLKSLEILAKRFPSEQKMISQVVDPKDSGAKYLPISTQIIAANTDINNSKETLERLKEQQAQMIVLSTWVKMASPLIMTNYNGITLTEQLLGQEAKLRATLNSADPRALVFVDGLRLSLLANDVRFTNGFEMNTAPSAKKKGMLKSTAGGMAAAFFLMLLVLLSQRLWASIKGSAKISGVQ